MADPFTVLVTNDDGVNAEGLAVLEAMAAVFGGEVWTVAPETEQSGSSHSLSLSNPLRLRKLAERRFAVQGTPSDSVLMAVRKVLPRAPDLIVSGVNRGQNMADDVTYSGTVAAAMEGTALGLRSIAFSQTYGVHSEGRLRWDVAAAHGPALLKQLAAIELGPGVFLNVNFPDCEPAQVEGVEVTRQGKRDQNQLRVEERRDTRGQPYFWLGFQRESPNPAPGTDLSAVFGKRISVTPLHMNLTQVEAMEALRTRLSG